MWVPHLRANKASSKFIYEIRHSNCLNTEVRSGAMVMTTSSVAVSLACEFPQLADAYGLLLNFESLLAPRQAKGVAL